MLANDNVNQHVGNVGRNKHSTYEYCKEVSLYNLPSEILSFFLFPA
jgi:hypothetical protein